MAGKAGLKAGLIGAAGVGVLTVLSVLLSGPWPILGRVGGGLIMLAYIGSGLLAGLFLAAPRSAGMGARAGALAGLIGGAGSGIVWIIAVVARVTQISWDGIMPVVGLREMPQPTDLGVTAEMLAVMIGGLCFLTSLLAGAGLGAIGGAVFGAARRD
jgi:hypothetical protein